MTENKKIGWRRFNVLDVIIVLLVVLCVVGVFQRQNIRDLFRDEEEQEKYEVAFEIRALREDFVKLLGEAEKLTLTDGEKEIPFGTLKEYTTSVATAYMQNAEGETVTAIYPQGTYYDIEGTVVCTGVTHDGAFYLGGEVFLAANTDVTVHTETMDITLHLLALGKAG